jgi:hypothetical protein
MLSRQTLGYLALAALATGAVALPASQAGAATAAPSSIATAATVFTAGDYVAAAHPVTTSGTTTALHAAVLPASVDLRAKVPAVSSQGQVGDCTAWAIGYYSIGYLANASGGSGAPFAPLYIYLRSLTGSSTAPTGGTSGWDTLTEAAANGIDTQANYVQGATNWQVAPTAAEIANASKYKVTSWSHLFQGTGQGGQARTEIEQSLASGAPVAVAFEVYANFEALGPNQVYTGPAGADEGGHMVAAVGYNATGLIIRNSWGTTWGTAGDATLSWAFVDQYAEDAYSIAAVSTPSGGAAPTSQPGAPAQAASATVAQVPTVTSVSPATVSAAGGSVVTVVGSHFTGVTVVHLGAVSVRGVPWSDTVLKFIAPAHAAGVIAVQAVSTGGPSQLSPGDRLTYVPAPAKAAAAKAAAAKAAAAKAAAAKAKAAKTKTTRTVKK